MSDPDSLFSLAALAAFVIFIFGSWTLHARLRNGFSRVFFGCVLSLVLWAPLSMVVNNYVIGNFEESSAQSTLNWLYLASDIAVPAVLLLAIAISFTLAARTIGRS